MILPASAGQWFSHTRPIRTILLMTRAYLTFPANSREELFFVR